MKEISALHLPENLRYTESHEWARFESGWVVVGISDFAQDQLGDIVFVDLPAPGRSFRKGDEFGAVESVKAVSEIYSPVAGEVVAVNTELESAPELVNQDPYGRGWMLRLQPADPAEFESLLDKAGYLASIQG